MRVVAALVPDRRPRHAEGGVGRRQIAVIEVEGEVRADVVAHPGDRLVAELPVVVAQLKAWECRPLGLVDDIDRADADADMRRHRPAEIDVIDQVAHRRMGLAAARGPGDRDAGDAELVETVAAVGVFLFEAPRPHLVADPRTDREPLVVSRANRGCVGHLEAVRLVVEVAPAALAAEIDYLRCCVGDKHRRHERKSCAGRQCDPHRHLFGSPLHSPNQRAIARVRIHPQAGKRSPAD